MSRHKARRRRSPNLLDLPGLWLNHHLQSAIATLGRLMRTPLPTWMTIAVIGISLALPAALYVVTENLRTMAGGWDQAAAISLFLRHEIDDAAAARIAEELRSRPELAQVHLISREQALNEFRALGGFEEALSQLQSNPLPAVLALYPDGAHSTAARLEALQTELLTLPEVDFARMDTLWVQRFQAILDLAQRAVLLLGALLGVGVLLIVGNTIRLEILNRRIEIEIMELVGATGGFIRRPFLYAGAWYGLLGALTAWLLVSISVLLLQQPVSRLATLYRSEFPLSGLGPLAMLVVLLGSVLFSLIGSWIAVNRHLRDAGPA
ncbi:MAG: permease-like cell division protein FtsX [Thiocapsa sp.]|jgi:cell division transport system permease protein|nr:permease-like cell division protein FtsX [Thiocapsa sp.]MCG6896676.1 permease-like cell division protein FtsX [Thiocapsa sp.]MCG6984725.1 permease-like cell division protein FtsX [Thiocapsa sp.]